VRWLLAIAAVLVAATYCRAAEFYVSSHSKAPSWRQAAAHERVRFLLKEGGTDVVMHGEIKDGDFAQLTAIHALIPIHTIRVSSTGGSVAEAVKFMGFVDKYSVDVTTLGCRRDPEECVCASACAFIWLGAPVRGGHRIYVHRPYFRSDEFASRTDIDAMREYEQAANQIRSLLLGKGYSQDFINKIFRTPREQARSLTPEEIHELPIDVALDELLSARCYRGNQGTLAKRHALYAAASQAEKEADAIRSGLPGDKPGYELEADPLYRKDFKEWLALLKKADDLRKQARSFDQTAHEFSSCKYTERRRISLRKSGGERLTNENRELLRRFANLLKDPDAIAAAALIAKSLPDHELGQKTREELLARQRELPVLIEEMRASLPAVHFEYIAAALEKLRP
jgi:hypothetical protein